MTTKKAKKKYTKRNPEYWAKFKGKPEARPEAHIVIASPKPQADNRDLLGTILGGIDRLSLGDKARVFSYILGKENFDESHLKAFQNFLA